MDSKDKKEIVGLVGQVVENVIDKKVLTLVDSLKLELAGFRKEANKNFKKLGERMEDVEKGLDNLEFKTNRFERKLDSSIDRYDDNFEKQEKRISVLEGKRLS